MFLNLDAPVRYGWSNDRFFQPGEVHITRVCKEFVLLIMLEGELTFSEAGVEKSVKAGEWYIQIPGPQGPSSRPCQTPVYYFVHFEASLCPTDAPHAMPLRGTFLQKPTEKLIARLHSAAVMPSASQLQKQGALIDLLLSLTAAPPQESSLVKDVLGYLQQCMPRTPSAEEISRHFGYSSDHISQLFRQAYGITPFQFSLQLRLQRAASLLTTSARSMEQIALDCGWTSPAIFYRAFCKTYGMAPTQYRKRQLGH